MNLKTLSDDELQDSIKRLKKNETEATLAILYHLIEIEDRGLFRDAGYASLFDYCHRGLGYSEGGAGRRVAARTPGHRQFEQLWLYIPLKSRIWRCV